MAYASHEVDDAFDIGIGVGYQVNEYFRVDLTGEYVFVSDFNATTTGYCGGAVAPAAYNCSSTEEASFDALKLLANAYVDLGNYSGFTPYVGAGLGGAYVSWSDLVGTSTCAVAPCTGYPAVGGTFTTTEAGVSDWRFAWALHAGFSYDLTQSFKLDVGYTYSRIEGGDMFDSFATTGNRFQDDGITSHVVRAGVRYQIW